MAGEIQLNSTTMATESSGSITAELDRIRPNTINGSLTLQGDSSNTGVTGLTIDSSGVVNTTTAKVTNIQATSGQSLTIKDEDGNAAITIGTDNTAAGYLSLNFGSYHGDSGGAGSGTLSGNTLDDYETGTWTPLLNGNSLGTNKGHYTKIGNRVILAFNDLAAASTINNGSNGSITGFPFVISPGSGTSYDGGNAGVFNFNDASDTYKAKGCAGRLTRPSTNDFTFTNSSGVNIVSGDPTNFFVIMQV